MRGPEKRKDAKTGKDAKIDFRFASSCSYFASSRRKRIVSGGFLRRGAWRRHRELRWRHPDLDLRRLRGCGKETEELRKSLFHRTALHDHVEHSVLEEVLRPLEAGRERLADGLLDHPRPGESDESLRLGDVEVPE